MKKVICAVLILAMLLSTVPAFGASEPYSVVSEFDNGKTMGVVVKANENFSADFVLVAALCKDDTVIQVKCMKKSELSGEVEIAFDALEGAYIKLFAWKSLAGLQPAEEDYISTLTYEEIMSQLKTANDYWIKRNSTIRSSTNPWDVAVFHTGNMQAYYMTGDETYRKYSTLWSDVNAWNFHGSSISNPDNVCCYQTYIDLYNIDKNESYLTNVYRDVDKLLNTYPLSYLNWIDTFYMAGPVFTKMYELTGDKAYLDKLYNMVKYTAENLNCYDEEVGLWFRDASFINQISTNGEHVYWSRGDGWVFAAFARIIEELPDDYEHKSYFVDIFCEMAQALKKVQCEDGAWHESLMDPDYNPTCEESGTGFFVYGLMWGINNGYLEESEYIDCIGRGWKWLTEVALQKDGSIGYVQHIGAQPTKDKLTANTTEDYAYANFVFAASEIAKYLGGIQGDVMPYLNKKLLGNIEVYKKDSIYAIKQGEIVKGDVPFLTDDGIYNGSEYVAMGMFVPDGMYVYEKDGVYVISEFITPFNKTEENLIDVISESLDEGKFPEREYSDPDRIKVTVNTSSGYVDEEYTEGNITVSEMPQAENSPSNMIDGDIYTYWAAYVDDESEPAWATFDLKKETEISKIGLAFNNGNIRTTAFSLSVSCDGKDYTEVIPKTDSSGDTTKVEYYEFDAVNARYVRLYGYSNSNPNTRWWFSPSEAEIYSSAGERLVGYGSAEAEPDRMDIDSSDVYASFVAESFNGVDKAFDNNLNTYFALRVDDENSPEYLQIDLGEAVEINRIALAFRMGSSRSYMFALSVSEDNVNFTEVLPKTYSSGTTDTEEVYTFNAVKARYVRLYGYGYTTSMVSRNIWFSLSEMAVYRALEDVDVVLPPQSTLAADLTGLAEAEYTAKASVIKESENDENNLNDDDFTSYCMLYVTDKSKGEYVDLDLGKIENVAYLALAFRDGRNRTTTFHIEVSEDGKEFTAVVPKCISNRETEGFEYFAINSDARYIRIYGYENSFNQFYVSITEAAVYVK